MYDRVTENARNVFAWLERLDRLGYVCAGVSLLLVGMCMFLFGWLSFAKHVRENSVLDSSLALVNTLLLVVILLELFRTIVKFLETDVLRVEPYLAVGIIACVRRMLTATAELGDLRGVPTDFLEKYLKDMSLNAGLVIVLVVGIFILRSKPVQSGEHDSPHAGKDSRKADADRPAISATSVLPKQT
jgi:uncharacterized membrane protein (DUF373 family)